MTDLEKQQAQIILEQAALITKQAAIIERQAQQIKLLEEKVDYLIHRLHGKSSEKVDPQQIELFEQEFAKKLEAASQENQDLELAAKTSNKHREPRNPRLPDDLPVTEIVIIPEEVQAHPEDYYQVNRKESKRLDVQPARFSLVKTIRPVYIKKNQLVAQFLTAPLPPCLLEKSILSPSLLSHIVTAKFCDHLPLYRQEQILTRRHNIQIRRNTLCEWIDVAAQWLEPLYKLIAKNIRASHSINVDETPVKYLATEGGSKDGYFWVYYSPHAGVLYDWTTSRGHECLDVILSSSSKGDQSFRGQLLCDGYGAYQTWANKQNDVKLAACWAHARRKFKEANNVDGDRMVGIIQKLYHAEEQYKKWLEIHKHPAEAIAYYRKRYSKPIIAEIHKHAQFIRKQHHKYPPSCKLMKAVHYLLNQWQKLGRTMSNGWFNLDNNVAENAVRPLKLGAKNWMFIGREDTGWRSAVIYTLVENIRLHKCDPYAYLKWVFEKLPTMTNQDDLSLILPEAWLAENKSEEVIKLAKVV